MILAGPVGQPTSRALATLDAHGAASYEFDLSWDVRGLRLAEESIALHIGSLGVVLTPGGEQVLRAGGIRLPRGRRRHQLRPQRPAVGDARSPGGGRRRGEGRRLRPHREDER